MDIARIPCASACLLPSFLNQALFPEMCEFYRMAHFQRGEINCSYSNMLERDDFGGRIYFSATSYTDSIKAIRCGLATAHDLGIFFKIQNIL